MPRRSAGVLVHRSGEGGLEVLLAHPGGPYYVKKDDGVWSIPKGELEGDEEPLTAAVREFTEEMGSPPPAGEPRPLGEARQRSGKVNLIWAIEGEFDVAGVRSNTFPMEWPPRSGRIRQVEEVDRADWFDLATARVKISPSQLPFLDRLESQLAAADGLTPSTD